MQVDGVGSGSKDKPNPQVLIIGATNRPMDLDEAALRRLTKRIYITLPDPAARKGAILKLLEQAKYDLTTYEIRHVVQKTENFSFADINAVIKDSAMGPIRDLQKTGEFNPDKIMNLDTKQLRPVNFNDVMESLSKF